MSQIENLPAVGFIGLGIMGRSMAGHLLAAGHKMLVYNRSRDKADEDKLMAIVLEAGADDLRDDGAGNWEVLSPPEAHEAVLAAMQKEGFETESAEVGMIPKNLIKLEGKSASGMIRMSEALEDHEDVQNVYSNFDIDEKEMEALA